MPGASVGVREDGDDNLTAANDFSDVESAPTQHGSTVIQTHGAHGLDAAHNLQPGGEPTTNPFQEVNMFVGEMANQFTEENGGVAVGPRATWERIRAIGDQMFLQSFS